MKKLKALLLGVLAVLALASCSGKEVSSSDFKKEAQKAETTEKTKEYTSLTITYKYTGEAGGEKDNYNWTYSFTFEGGEWKTDATDAYVNDAKEWLKTTAATYAPSTDDSLAVYSEYGEASIKYYVNPFSVKLSTKFDYTGTIVNFTVKGSASSTAKFNEYGLLTSLTAKGSVNYKLGEDTNTIKYNSSLTISYK